MKDNILIGGFLIILFGFMLSSILLPDKEVSISERRKLEQMPHLKVNGAWNSDYFKELDKYFIDQFPLRENLRHIKMYSQLYLLGKQDNDDVFLDEDYLFLLNDDFNKENIQYFINKIKEIKDQYLTSSNQIFYSIIPDKQYYSSNLFYPRYDYLRLEQMLQNNLDISYINLFSMLELNDYYKTDIHWKNDKLEKVAEYLITSMDRDYVFSKKEIKKVGDFYGSLYYRFGISLEPDELVYLTNKDLENIRVWNMEKNKYEGLYNKNINLIDGYDFYLSGATPLLTIYNDKVENDQELIIFRDSFASSLTPLLIESYEKITLIDLRYISASILSDYVDFSGSDILFLYSVPVINNGKILK